MSETRRPHWPTPVDYARTIHLIGDIQTPSVPRRQIVTADMSRLPDLPTRVTVGDFINSGGSGWPDSAYTPMIEFIESLGTGAWYSSVGNHDAHGRSPSEAAALMGMPGRDFVIDLGYVVLVVLYTRCRIGNFYTGPDQYTDLAWLDATLAAHSDRRVVVVGHAPLYDPRSINNVATNETAIIAVLDAYPCVVSYWCGHTHVPITHKGILTALNTGSRTIAQLNASALVYTSPTPAHWTNRLCSLFVTLDDDKMEVRFRDHGARVWVEGGGERTTLWGFDFA